MKKLISSIEFGKTLKEQSDSDYRRLRDEHDLFLEQPLKKGDFVPCDEEDNVLEEPLYSNTDLNCDELDKLNNEIAEYQQAQDRVIFDGFKIDFITLNITGTTNIVYNLWFYENGVVTINSTMIETIEDLIPYNLNLKNKQNGSNR